MNRNVGSEVVPLADSDIKENLDSKESLPTSNTENEQSAVGCAQMFSDKSQTNLSAGAFKFYPLQI